MVINLNKAGPLFRPLQNGLHPQLNACYTIIPPPHPILLLLLLLCVPACPCSGYFIFSPSIYILIFIGIKFHAIGNFFQQYSVLKAEKQLESSPAQIPKKWARQCSCSAPINWNVACQMELCRSKAEGNFMAILWENLKAQAYIVFTSNANDAFEYGMPC